GHLREVHLAEVAERLPVGALREVGGQRRERALRSLEVDDLALAIDLLDGGVAPDLAPLRVDFRDRDGEPERHLRRPCLAHKKRAAREWGPPRPVFDGHEPARLQGAVGGASPTATFPSRRWLERRWAGPRRETVQQDLHPLSSPRPWRRPC